MAGLLLSAAAGIILLVSAAAAFSFEESNPIRSVTDGVLSLESHLISVLGRTRSALHFARFAQRYGKSYGSAEEMKFRFAIFEENFELIQCTNRRGLPYKLGINRFADLSWEEFRASRLGAAQNCSATLKGGHKLTGERLPETKDWREDGIVSPVKDQGHCGSCWTFSFGEKKCKSGACLKQCLTE